MLTILVAVIVTLQIDWNNICSESKNLKIIIKILT